MNSLNIIKNEIYDWLISHKEQFTDDLSQLIAIPSVEDDSDGAYPYGKNCAAAIDAMTALCEKYGFNTKNFNYHAATAVFEGKSKEIGLDILSHLDVVAAGTGWNTEPFSLVQKNGFIFGRGVADDKGPALASLYAARALKELGLLPEKSVKLIFGSAEETGSSDLKYYFKTEKSAPYTFTPDADFPVYNGEKGRYCAEFSMTCENETGAKINSFICGNAPNIVPEISRSSICGIEAALVREVAASLEKELSVKYEIEEENGFINLLCRGKSAHASTPHLGTNALTAMIKLLVSLPFDSNKSFDAFKSLARLLPHGDTNGKNMGVYMKEDVSGEITVAFSMLHYDGKRLLGVCDSRLPFCATYENSKAVFEKNLRECGFTADGDMSNPHYVENDSSFVKSLLKCYEAVTGLEGKTHVMGGGTYVHDIEGGVAFGPVFENIDYDVNLHGANECIKLSDLLLAATIYAIAILEVAK